MSVQSVIFDRELFDEAAARSWLAASRFESLGKMHPTARYLRFRQYEPDAGERYRTKALPNHPGIKLIIQVSR